jgi:glucose-6-phosphate isomerase
MGTLAHFLAWRCHAAEIGLVLDTSRMNLSEAHFQGFAPKFEAALREMAALEAGAIANADENRMVGHYWLRAPHLAPLHLQKSISQAIAQVQQFARAVHEGHLRAPTGALFSHVLNVGIGGSALGPQLVSDALGSTEDRMKLCFLDNTDPDGIDRVLGSLKGVLAETLVVVISKSGGTKETRNGMLETQQAFSKHGLAFEKQAVAVTQADSELFRNSASWLAQFPMWDWIGGRTSVLSVVGLLPAALQGISVDSLLEGARLMDFATRETDAKKNPALMLAYAWYIGCEGHAKRDLVVLPYKDRLLLLSRYLQQLVMESLGKELDRSGQTVHQGLSVYGNKGSTDQHAYVQQLRDGPNNFFALFIEVLKTRSGPSMQVDPLLTSGDYLHGFLQGTRDALSENGRQSTTLTVAQLDTKTLAAFIALFERAVGFYASFINVNAYHQPGVEAGKKGAERVLDLQSRLRTVLENQPSLSFRAVSDALTCDEETLFRLCEHLAANVLNPAEASQYENLLRSAQSQGSR